MSIQKILKILNRLLFIISVLSLFSGCATDVELKDEDKFYSGKELGPPLGSEFMNYRKNCNELGGKLPERCND